MLENAIDLLILYQWFLPLVFNFYIDSLQFNHINPRVSVEQHIAYTLDRRNPISDSYQLLTSQVSQSPDNYMPTIITGKYDITFVDLSYAGNDGLMAFELVQKANIQWLTVNIVQWYRVLVPQRNYNLGESIVVECMTPWRAQVDSGQSFELYFGKIFALIWRKRSSTIKSVIVFSFVRLVNYDPLWFVFHRICSSNRTNVGYFTYVINGFALLLWDFGLNFLIL